MITTKEMLLLMDEMLSVANVTDMSQAMPEATYNLVTLNAIRDFIAAHSWQPIETAPMGREILVYCPSEHGLGCLICVCKWHEDAGFCVDELRSPTYWMLLPAAPQSKEVDQ